MNIHKPRRLPKPSTLLATAALVVATGGTAVAAGPIITDPSQIAPGVITGLHIKQQAVTKFDLDDPYLRIKVNSNGTLNGSKNDSGAPGVVRVSKGTYDVTFNSTTINGSDGSSDESLLSKNCALSAQPRSKLALSVVDGPTNLRPDTVRVETSMLDATGKTTLFGAVDTPFDLIAVC
jgi:hypothetical protein